MNLNRLGENGKVPSRSDRFFHVDKNWYFQTREGTPIGPYDSRAQASIGLYDFIEFLRLASPRILVTFFNSLAKNRATH